MSTQILHSESTIHSTIPGPAYIRIASKAGVQLGIEYGTNNNYGKAFCHLMSIGTNALCAAVQPLAFTSHLITAIFYKTHEIRTSNHDQKKFFATLFEEHTACAAGSLGMFLSHLFAIFYPPVAARAYRALSIERPARNQQGAQEPQPPILPEWARMA